MTELELYKFVNENNCEWHWVKDPNENLEIDNDVALFVDFHYLKQFTELLDMNVRYDETADNGKFYVRDGYICFPMREICEYSGIELIKVFNYD